MNGYKWDLTNREEVIDDMYHDNSNILIDKVEELKEIGMLLDPKIINKFKRFIIRRENDETKNKIKEEIKLLLYNKLKNLFHLKN